MKLEIESIFHSYTHNLVLDGIYLKLHTGNIIGIMGKNGSGKTTLFKILFGILPCPGGIIRINDHNINRRKLKRYISYLPQISFLPRSVTVKKIISLFLNNNRVISTIMNEKRISSLLLNKVAALSVGEKRYLEFLLIYYLEKPVMLLDEPFSEIDPIYSEHMIHLLKQIKDRRIIIMTDHDYRNILLTADRYFLLENGELSKINDEDELKAHHYLPPS
jgi:ABC-type multidrug transport system ATPase subunit